MMDILNDIPAGRLCGCGCGAVIPERSKAFRPRQFVDDHQNRCYASGPQHCRWRGGTWVRGSGKTSYRIIGKTGRPEHIVIAEQALGKPLPPGAHVHHANRNGLDNNPGNLVLCENAAYHALLHVRMRALEECGNAEWRKCVRCKKWDEPGALRAHRSGKSWSREHPACTHARNLAIRQTKRAAQ